MMKQLRQSNNTRKPKTTVERINAPAEKQQQCGQPDKPQKGKHVTMNPETHTIA